MSLVRKLALPLVALALVVGAFVVLTGQSDVKTLTARYPRAISIYVGSDVRVLGVPVGKVDSVVPDGTDVIVTMHYDSSVKVPEDADAIIVAPSIVGDRYVQLTPVYESGPTLADGAELGTDRTSVPLELDQINSSIDGLLVALGPDGANKDGALSDLLQVTAKNFAGQGENFHTAIKNFGKLSATLDDNRDALFDSQAKLESFVSTLAKNDGTVRRFNDSLASVSQLLAGERNNLAGALKNLSVALGEVNTFVQDNKQVLSDDIKGLNQFASVLVKRRAELEETLRDAPLALNNLALTYNPQAGTLDTSSNAGEIFNQIETDPSTFLCGIVNQADSTGALCDALQAGLPRPGALKALRGTSTQTADENLFDLSLGGLVEVDQ